MLDKTAFPLAALLVAFCTQATAQSSVTVYGIVDTGVEYQKVSAGSSGPAVTRKQLVNGTYSVSRLGFRGAEDLGDGLRAFFHLEHGFNPDDGTVTGAAFWGRKSIVGLGGRWGELSLGRDYTPGFWAQFITDVNLFAMYGNSGTMSAFALTGMLRANNGVYYVSPEFNGFRGRLTYSFSEDAGRIVGVSGEYRSSTLSAAVYRQERRSLATATSPISGDNVYQGLTALYDFGRWGVSGGVVRYDPAGPDSATSGAVKSVWASVIVRFGLSDVRINVGRLKTNLSGPTDGKSTIVGVNFSHQLSKRTSLYLGAGRVSNNVSAQFGLEGGSRAIPNNGRDSDTTAIGAGIRHAF